jgi:hypothetical protein
MKFEIFGDKPTVKIQLEEFSQVAKAEYEKQRNEGIAKAFKNMMPELEFVIEEKENSIVFANSIPSPHFLLRRKVVGNMIKNLKAFLKSKGCQIKEIKFLGD